MRIDGPSTHTFLSHEPPPRGHGCGGTRYVTLVNEIVFVRLHRWVLLKMGHRSVGLTLLRGFAHDLANLAIIRLEHG